MAQDPRPVTPRLTVDAVVVDREGRVLMIRRKYPPFAGALALPGGFVEVGERVEDACRRELEEETGVQAGALHLVGVYSDPARDPRGHTCSVVYLTEVDRADAAAGSDAAAVEWVSDPAAHDLAFDHVVIVKDALALKSRL